LFLSRPLVTVPLRAKLLKVTPKAVDLMLGNWAEPCHANSTAENPLQSMGYCLNDPIR